MFHAKIINDADKLNDEVNRYKEIPVVSHITQQHAIDNYYQVKIEVKRLNRDEVERLKAERIRDKLSKSSDLRLSFTLQPRANALKLIEHLLE